MRAHVTVFCTVNIVAAGHVLSMMVAVFWNEKTRFVYSSVLKATPGTRQSSKESRRYLMLLTIVTFHCNILYKEHVLRIMVVYTIII